ncbi:hypothetical protein [Streptomyces bluensis]|uniref:hypothetical protein n=1 Tax=Streptomyces bluensis TaxID=33897 RepID=UPI003320DF2B
MIHAIAIDFAGTLTTNVRCRPTGHQVRNVLRDQFDVDVPDEFVDLYDLSFWRYYVESLPSTMPQLLTATARRSGIHLPDFRRSGRPSETTRSTRRRPTPCARSTPGDWCVCWPPTLHGR